MSNNSWTTDLSKIIKEEEIFEVFKKKFEEISDRIPKEEISQSTWKISLCLSPLHYACLQKRQNVIKYLVDFGFNINSKVHFNNLQITPLHYAIFLKSEEIIEFLLTLGANPNIIGEREFKKKTYFGSGLQLSNQIHGISNDIKTKLILIGLNLFLNSSSSTVKDIESIYNSSTIEFKLNTIQETVLDKFNSPIHQVVSCNGNTDVLKYLLKLGFDINSKKKCKIKDATGKYFYFSTTPLHAALLNKNLNFTQILIENGADPNLKAFYLILSKEREFQDLKELSALEIVKTQTGYDSFQEIFQNHCKMSLNIDKNQLSNKDLLEINKQRIEKKSKLQKKLNEALRIQTDISDLEQLKKSNFDKIEKLQNEIQNWDYRIRDLSTNPSNLSPDKISDVISNISEIDNFIQDLKKLVSSEKPTNAPILCLICFEQPKAEIYCCAQCDKIFCNNCNTKISLCPFCRINFKSKKPQRVKCVEKIIEEICN